MQGLGGCGAWWLCSGQSPGTTGQPVPTGLAFFLRSGGRHGSLPPTHASLTSPAEWCVAGVRPSENLLASAWIG